MLSSADFGNGKSEALCRRAIVLSYKFPTALGLIGRATYPELRDSTVRSFFEVCEKDGIPIESYNKMENTCKLKGGGEIIFRAFDKPEKILSLNLGWFLIDQLEEITEETFLQLLGRLRHADCRYAGGVGNPEPGWVKRRFKDNADKDVDLLFIEATSEENPYLPADYVENLKKNYPDFWVKRYVYGDWNTFEGQIFSHFVESKHVIDPFEIPRSWKHEYVVDYGFRNPLACLKIYIDHDDNYYLTDEHYAAEKVISEHAEYIKAMGYTKQDTMYIDPSCSAKNHEKNGLQVSYIDEFNDAGIWPIPASNNIVGLSRVNQWFKDDRLKIFRNCTNTIREVGELRWKKVKPSYQGNLPEQEEDKNNHTTDCLKYFSNSRPISTPEPKHIHDALMERKRVLMGTSKKRTEDWYES